MKAILREYNNDHYVVKDVTFSPDGNFQCENMKVSETNVVALIGHDKAKFVRCSACGEIIPNNKKAIDAHHAAHNTYEGCFGCRYLRSYTTENGKGTTKYTLNDDNTFNRKINDTVNLRCSYYYGSNNITDDDRIKKCMYRGCANSNMDSLKTFFDTYPNAFDDMITIDAIKNFKEINKYGVYTKLKLKCRGNIYALVNNKGIVSSFFFESRYDNYEVYYSKKYNKLFYRSGTSYRELSRPYNMTVDRWNYIKETIAKLYN